MELVNPVAVGDAEAWLKALSTTLLGNPYADDFSRRVARWTADWEPERTWAVRDHGRIVATLATETRQLAIPAGGATTTDIAADALTGVTVAATHRRQGLLTRMIGESLQAAKDRGDAVAILIAAEWPIYGRFGYAPALDAATITYRPRARGAALPAPRAGSLRQVEARELGQVARDLYAAARRLRPGQIDRDGSWWDRRLSLKGFEPIGDQPHWILHEGADGPDGLLAWRVTRDFELDGSFGAVEVSEFIHTSDEAYRDMWAYLGGIDVVDEIRVDDRPLDEPIRLVLGDARAWSVRSVYDYMWLRLLDLPAALAARGYATAGRLVLDVSDDSVGGYGGGRVLLETDGTTSTCTPTDASPDLRITQRALASSYLGGHRLRKIALAGGVEEVADGALDRADVMFSVPLAPLNQTGF